MEPIARLMCSWQRVRVTTKQRMRLIPRLELGLKLMKGLEVRRARARGVGIELEVCRDSVS